MSQLLTLTQPDDWHIHLRDGVALKRTVNDAARQFNRAIVMPNLVPPVVNAAQAVSYHQRIMQNLASELSFDPLMVLYLTDNTQAEDILAAHQTGLVKAVKIYPAGATTNSDSGVTDILAKSDVYEVMQSIGMPLLIHGEVTDSHIDIFDREKVFIERTMIPLRAKFPALKIVFEHITTKDAADFVVDADGPMAATITPQHLMFNRNDMLVGGIRPHYFCLPILKRNIHQDALVKVATSGNTRFFLGTDSAPHATDKKEAACGCAGCYSAFSAIELYAQVFDEANALDKLEAFAAFNGPDFYGMPRNTETITLMKKAWQLPAQLDYLDGTITPLLAGEQIQWQIQAG
ncbi:MAG: dihydroorotase [Pseudomonadales bacterium]|nr:dihydroorotase [Pseudomonadales bacterium]